jgi:DNA-binding NarL/FixJ family response regulator
MYRPHWKEGTAWLDGALADADGHEVDASALAAALTASANLWAANFSPGAPVLANRAVELARQVGDDRLLARALIAAGAAGVVFGVESTLPCWREAVDLARANKDLPALAEALDGLAQSELAVNPLQARHLASEAHGLAQQVGHRGEARFSAILLGIVMLEEGDLADSRALLVDTAAEAHLAGDEQFRVLALAFAGWSMALMGEPEPAREAARQIMDITRDLGVPFFEYLGHFALFWAALAAGEPLAAIESFHGIAAAGGPTAEGLAALVAEAEIANGDIDAARDRVDAAIIRSANPRRPLAQCLLARGRIAALDQELGHAEDLAHRALVVHADIDDKIGMINALELIASVAASQQSYDEAARLYGATAAQRKAIRYARLGIHRGPYDTSVKALREALSEEEFAQRWAQGEALTLQEATSYASRGRGDRKRPSTGWASLTPAEVEVTGLIGEGFANKEIAKRLFLSPRTVQAHLTHIYAKLGITSRTRLAQEANRRH